MDLHFPILLVLIGRYYVISYEYNLDDNFNIKVDELMNLVAKANRNAKDQSKTTCWKLKKIFTSITAPSELDDIKTGNCILYTY